VGALTSALCSWGDGTQVWVIAISCRLILGIGAGGVYPLAAAKAAESADCCDIDGKAVAAGWAFFWRNPAIVFVYFLGLVLFLGVGNGAVPKEELPDGYGYPYNAGWDAAWRIHLGFGAVPCVFTAVLATREYMATKERVTHARSRMSNPLVSKETATPPDPGLRGSLNATFENPAGDEGENPVARLLLLEEVPLSSLSQWRKIVACKPWRALLTTAGGWFVFDLAYYGNSLLQPRVLRIMHPEATVEESAVENMGIATMGILFTLLIIPTIPKLGVRTTQIWGFVLNAVMSLVLALSWTPLAEQKQGGTLFALYALLYGSYWIMNVTTYVMSSVAYPPEVRTTLAGISAACGKAGAVIGTYEFGNILDQMPEQENEAVTHIMTICTGLAFAGIWVTVLGVGAERYPPGFGVCCNLPVLPVER